MKWKSLTCLLLSYLLITGIIESIKISDFNDYYSASKNFFTLQDLYYLDKIESLKNKEISIEKLITNSEIISFFKGKLGSYIYPPTFAFLLIPFSFLDYQYSSILWFLLNYFSLILVFYLLSKKFHIENFSFSWLILLLANFKFIQSHQSNNQVGLVLLLLILLSILSKKDILSSIFLSLSIVIKLTPAIFFIYFFYKKRYKVILFSTIFIFLWLLLPSLYDHDYNIKMISNWYDLVIENFMKNPAARAWKNNQSLIATLSKYFVPYADFVNQLKFGLPFFEISIEIIKLLNFLIAFMFVILFIYCFFRKMSDFGIISILFLSSLILSGISWLHSFVFLIFPSFYIYSKFNQMNKREKYCLYSILFLLFVVNKNIIGSFLEQMFFMYSWLLYLSFILIIYIYKLDLKYKLKS